MRILTVRQPWALHIMQSGKDVENRSRNIAGNYRGPVAIHAALKGDEEALYRLPKHAPNGIPRIFRTGVIIAVADLVGVHYSSEGQGCYHKADVIGWVPLHDTDIIAEGWKPTACSEWAELGQVHLVFANPRPLKKPLKFKGALGLRELPADVTAEIEARL